MNASDLASAGFYWCSHDLFWGRATDGKADVSWVVVEFVPESEWSGARVVPFGMETSLRVDEVPEYVKFIGPLEPPA